MANERREERGRRLRGRGKAGLGVAIGQGGYRPDIALVGERGTVVESQLHGLSSCGRRKW